jgi:hypothetical protein
MAVQAHATTSVYLSKIENSLEIKRIIKHEQQPVDCEFTHTLLPLA